MKPALFLFNDFETTGTDLKLDKILEGYFDLILMDPDNGVTFHSLFSQHALIDSEYDRSTLHPIVEDMHTKNGLWDDLAANADNLVRIETLDSVVAAAVRQFKEEYNGATVHLAGMGVAAYDRRMIERDMPLVDGLLHYRPADVSITRMVLEQFGGWKVPEEHKELFSESAHRAKDDVVQGIAQARVFGELGAKMNAA